ncbi:MAG TPA: hypothetical protein VFV73_40250 [Streptosporangiaceae bacterium]|nr:hypothetical protein [Streptosporangiaceae bacterium]
MRPGVPQRRLPADVVEPRVLRGDLGLDPLGVPQQQVALLGGGRVPAGPVRLVDAHVLDAHAERAHAGQDLELVQVLGAVAAVPAALVAGDRADETDLLVVTQRRLAQPAAPGHVPDRQGCHAGR